jgi:hypothetical protein
MLSPSRLTFLACIVACTIASIACKAPPARTSAIQGSMAPGAVELEGLSVEQYVLVRDHVMPLRRQRGPELGGVAPIGVHADDEAAGPWSDRCPEDGLILTVVTRTVPRELAKDSERSSLCLFDRVWCTRAEALALVPNEPRVGEAYELTAGFTQRLARLHFLDAEGGAGGAFEAGAAEGSKLTAQVLSMHDSVVRLSITGEIVAKDDERTFTADVRGTAAWDYELSSFTSFDLVADAESTTQDGVRRVGFVLVLSRSPRADLLPPRLFEQYEPYDG